MKIPRSYLMKKIQTVFYKITHENLLTTNGGFKKSNNSSRRKFIKNTAVAGLNVAFFSNLNSCSLPNEESEDVIIIGGGIAGLNAGNKLKKAGINFKICEASKRLGGRIMTGKGGNGDEFYFEMGGEFIDSSHDDMLDLVKEFNLDLLDCVDFVSKNNLVKDLYFFNGRSYSESAVIEEFKKIAPKILEDQKLIEVNNEERLTELDNLSITDYLKNIGVHGWFFEMLNSAFTSEMGIEASEQSSLNLIDILDTDTTQGFKIFGDSDERFKISGGNSKLIKALEEQLNDRIVLNKKLNEIQLKNDLISLSFEDKTSLTCKYLILAVPFTVLRSIKLPSDWPIEKLDVIQQLGYGTNGKYFLGYNNCPWREQKLSGYLFNNTVQNGWDGTLFQNDGNGPSIYTVFLGGKEGKKVNDNQADIYVNALDEVFPNSKGQLSGYKSSFNWTNYKYNLGSYSVYKKGQWMTIAGNEATPINNVFFAGEHCSEDFQGYMNGGAQTGRIAAEEIIKLKKH